MFGIEDIPSTTQIQWLASEIATSLPHPGQECTSTEDLEDENFHRRGKYAELRVRTDHVLLFHILDVLLQVLLLALGQISPAIFLRVDLVGS